MSQPRIKTTVGREMRRARERVKRRPLFMTMLVLDNDPAIFELFTSRDAAAIWANENCAGREYEFVDKAVRR